MAWDFNGTTSPNATAGSRIDGGTVVTDYPFTMSAWGNRDAATTANRYLLSMYRTGSGATQGFGMGFGSAQTFMDVNGIATTAANTNTAGVWYHLAYVGRSATDRELFRNGVSVATDTNSRTVTGINNVTIGATRTGSLSPFVFSPFDGKIAEAAVWNVDLTNAEIAALAAGYRPSLIRPQSLRFHAPLVRELLDASRALALTAQNSAAATNDHPRRFG